MVRIGSVECGSERLGSEWFGRRRGDLRLSEAGDHLSEVEEEKEEDWAGGIHIVGLNPYTRTELGKTERFSLSNPYHNPY